MSKMTAKDIDDLNENRVVNMIEAQQIQIDILEQELDLMKKRFDNLWEIFQDTSNADSKFKRELLDLVGRLGDGS